MDIKLTFGKTIFENVDCWMVECSAEKSHTLEEWVEFAFEKYGMNHRVNVYLGETHHTFEAWNGTIETHNDDELQYEQFDIYKYKDVWGQRTLYLTLHGKTQEETQNEIWKAYGLPIPAKRNNNNNECNLSTQRQSRRIRQVCRELLCRM